MKIFERAIHKHLYDHLVIRISFYLNFNRNSDPVIQPVQPCSMFQTIILKNIDEGNLTGAVFLDLSKAFDMIDHSLLKIKLTALGVIGQALAWFNN